MNVQISREIRVERGGVPRGLQMTDREVKALEFLLDQKFGSREQVYRAVWKNQESKSSKYAWARLNLLEQHGLIRSVRVHTRGVLYYVVTPKGVRTLELKKPDSSILPPIRSVNYVEFEHDDRVTECRLALEEQGLSTDWKSERRLLADVLQSFPGNRREQIKYIARGRLADGVFRFKDGHLRAFELELAPKQKSRYRAKVLEYVQKIEEKRLGISGVLFVACSRRILEALKEATQLDPRLFFVMSYAELLKGGA